MIFQSDVPSTSSRSQTLGLTVTIIFHAILLAVILMIVLPAPEQKVEPETFIIKFGTDAPGGPFTEEGSAMNNDPSQNDPSLNESAGGAATADESEPTEETSSNQALNSATKPTPNPNPSTEPSPERRFKKSGSRKGSNTEGGGPTGGDDPNSQSRGNPNGDPNGELNGTLFNEKLPINGKLKAIRDVQLEPGEESDDPNPKKVKVLVIVGCKDGRIKKVKKIVSGSNYADINYLRSKLEGQKYFESYQGNCSRDIPGIMEVTIVKG